MGLLVVSKTLNRATNNYHVPSIKFNFIKTLGLFVVFSLLIQLINCRQQQQQQRGYNFNLQPATSLPFYYTDSTFYLEDEDNEAITNSGWNLLNTLSTTTHSNDIHHKPTPPLEREAILAPKHKRNPIEEWEKEERGEDGSGKEFEINSLDPKLFQKQQQLISPARVLAGRHYVQFPDNSLFSPIFNFQLMDPNIPQINSNLMLLQSNPIHHEAKDQEQQSSFLDTSNDFIEPGSGGWPMDSSFSDLIEATEHSIEGSTPNLSPIDLSNSIMSTKTLTNQYETNSLLQTVIARPGNDVDTDNINGINYNRAPILSRRLPKLLVTAGQVWKYLIPFDTFTDEDGDLRQLKSRISPRVSGNLGDGKQFSAGFSYYSWLQYDESSQLLYGFPTENDVGRHELVLVVSDRFGATGEETIEVNVKQHQSTRAFTHLFVINNIEWNRQRYPSMVDALGEFVKRLTTRVYQDQQPFKNFIVQYYSLNFQQSDRVASSQGNEYNNDIHQAIDNNSNNDSDPARATSFTIAWSNGSAPIHPCNLTFLETLTRSLVDVQALNFDWPSDMRGDQSATVNRQMLKQLPLSPNLTKALEPDFRPASLSLYLQGACEGHYLIGSKDQYEHSTTIKTAPATAISNSVQENDKNKLTNPTISEAEEELIAPRVRVKIGKLTWKLGEPIEYKIPLETFEVANKTSKGSQDRAPSTTRDFQLTLHTIDGLTLDKDVRYGFLEFDRETQTLYGLPYNQGNHAGQRELQLTAMHPKSGLKVREVFIVSIEAQDLTTINNRAFLMSLYVGTRSGSFGARERVALSRRLIEALHYGDPKKERDSDKREFFYHNEQNNQEISEMIVIEIQKFSIGMPANHYAKLSNVEGQLQSLNQAHNRVVFRVPDDGSEGEPLMVENFSARSQVTNDDVELASKLRVEANEANQFFYKFTWTNETIGYRGDCPVEVIKENILSALEQSMLEFRFPDERIMRDEEDGNKNDSVRFYNRLRSYFEPESNLIHLRFDPLGACINALALHDVGNSELADQADRAGRASDLLMMEEVLGSAEGNQQQYEGMPNSSLPAKFSQDLSFNRINQLHTQQQQPNSDEYWSIVVLIILVVGMIFVIIMFLMGMHTYKINQDKRFELQVRLAQARQNSIYLSSLILANQAEASDICTLQRAPKSIYVVQDEEKGSRKPVILDNEKELLIAGQLNPSVPSFKPTTVQLSNGQTATITTTATLPPVPMKPNMTFTLDSIAGASNWPQCAITMSPSHAALQQNLYLTGESQRSMTLHRRSSNSSQQRHQLQARPAMMFAPSGQLNHSHSILTVASLAGPLHPAPVVQHQARLPIVYSQLPLGAREPIANYSSLQRDISQQQTEFASMVAAMSPSKQASRDFATSKSNSRNEQNGLPLGSNHQRAAYLKQQNGDLSSVRSPSYSSSHSATVQSVISNPNFANQQMN